jgi:hypothetical protein
MTTEIVLFNEYIGKCIPSLPFDNIIKKHENKMPDDSPVYKNNIKIFEKDIEKRKIIIDIFTKAGFILLYDCTTHTINNKIIRCYDRLIFNG